MSCHVVFTQMTDKNRKQSTAVIRLINDWKMKCDKWTTNYLLFRQAAGTKLLNTIVLKNVLRKWTNSAKKKPNFSGSAHFRGKTTNPAAQLKSSADHRKLWSLHECTCIWSGTTAVCSAAQNSSSECQWELSQSTDEIKLLPFQKTDDRHIGILLPISILTYV